MKKETQYWHKLPDGKIQCDLCPRYCKLSSGQRGFCFVRMNDEEKIVLTTYGANSGLCIDPIEKKPLNHFYPGTSVLSVGTAGCNLNCKFCQNWDISKSREMETLSRKAMPNDVLEKLIEHNCKSLAFTYNDPVIFLEYARDMALVAQKHNIKTVAVTAGYINERPRQEFFSFINAVNVDLKAFSEDFYKKITGGSLESVLDTLLYLKNETSVWYEITNLVIPGLNDSDQEITQMCQWIFENLGPDIPLHFSAFHPDWKMQDRKQTSLEALLRARKIALDTGIHFVYTGNVHHKESASTYCPQCQKLLIERDWFQLGQWNIKEGSCQFCQHKIPGLFDERPGSWIGRKSV